MNIENELKGRQYTNNIKLVITETLKKIIKSFSFLNSLLDIKKLIIKEKGVLVKKHRNYALALIYKNRRTRLYILDIYT